jgi:hypothetical protein
MKIYVGCALTHASDEFCFQVEKLKRIIARQHEVLEFLGTTAGTPTDVYRQDIRENASNCELFLGICDLPSIGLGYELSYAIEKRGIPVLAVAHRNAHITRLILGIDKPSYTFGRYEDICRDVPLMIEDVIHKMLFMQHHRELTPEELETAFDVVI